MNDQVKTEPAGFLVIERGRVRFVAHAPGVVHFEELRPLMFCQTLALPFARQLLPLGVALVIDDEGRLKRESDGEGGTRAVHVTCWIQSSETRQVVTDLCGVVVLAGQRPDGELAAAPVSVLMRAFSMFVVMAPDGVYLPAADPEVTVVSFDNPSAWARFLGWTS